MTPTATETFSDVPSPCIGIADLGVGRRERCVAQADELRADHDRDLGRVVDVAIVACARACMRGDEPPTLGAQRRERGRRRACSVSSTKCVRAARDHVMAAQRAARRDRVQPVDADGVGRANDRGHVVRLVHGVHEHREVGLPTVEGALELRESLGCHRQRILRPVADGRRRGFFAGFGVGWRRMFQAEIEIATKGRGTYELTQRVADAVRSSRVTTGLCHVFTTHTSASLMICENADPDVRRDLETFMADLAPDGDRRFVHTAEGPDDMSAHVRSVLTQSDLTIPIKNGELALGTWQGVYLWEHRLEAHRRRVLVTIQS